MRPGSLFPRVLISIVLYAFISGAVCSEQVVYKPLDIPGADNPDVVHYRESFLTPFGIKKLAATLTNAEQYRLYVRKRLSQSHMPKTIEYLPFIESDYNPSARSKDGKGVGMWQFMPNSTSPFLICNEWVDERLDPWKSTDAALSKLQDNYKMFNDWLLAIAAYNCGAGAMTRILKTVPEKNFWYLSEHKLLPDHTMRYVPKLLAIADLVQNSSYYGITLPQENGNDLTPGASGEFDYVTVRSTVSLTQIARDLRLDKNLLNQLNAALLKEVTPPESIYRIRLPSGMKLAAERILSEKKIYVSLRQHQIVKGDTLWSLSRKYSVHIADICKANDISPKSVLVIGKILYIPHKVSDK